MYIISVQLFFWCYLRLYNKRCFHVFMFSCFHWQLARKWDEVAKCGINAISVPCDHLVVARNYASMMGSHIGLQISVGSSKIGATNAAHHALATPQPDPIINLLFTHPSITPSTCPRGHCDGIAWALPVAHDRRPCLCWLLYFYCRRVHCLFPWDNATSCISRACIG